MILTRDEWDRLEFLLGKDHVVGVDQTEMDEIVALIKMGCPSHDT